MKTNEDYEKEFIAACKAETGLELAEWMNALAATGLNKQKELTEYIKQEKGLNHLQATFLAGIYLNNGQPVYDQKVLRTKLLDSTGLSDLYLDLENQIKTEMPDVQFVACKGYISFRTSKEFGCARLNKKEIRVGMDLGDEPHTQRLVKAKSLGAMPRLAHMIVITSAKDLDTEVMDALKRAKGRI